MDKIYFDACCLNRPFDDQAQDRIRLESEAVLLVLMRVEHGQWEWIGSSVLEYEVSLILDPERQRRVRLVLEFATMSFVADADSFRRAQEIQSLGFKAVDALHVACAEQAGCSVLLTTDDRMLSAARRDPGQLRVRVENVVDWLRKVSPP